MNEELCNTGKERFVSAKAAHKQSENVYLCDECHGYHTGFKRDKKRSKHHKEKYVDISDL